MAVNCLTVSLIFPASITTLSGASHTISIGISFTFHLPANSNGFLSSFLLHPLKMPIVHTSIQQYIKKLFLIILLFRVKLGFFIGTKVLHLPAKKIFL